MSTQRVYTARIGNMVFSGRGFYKDGECRIYAKLSQLKSAITRCGYITTEDAFDAALAAAGGEIIAYDLVPNKDASIPIDVEVKEDFKHYRINVKYRRKR